jgi:hypothetical protein
MHFEKLSNELILCIWDQLSTVDVIFSFYDLNNRITALLYEFCDLYKKLDLRYSSLSACRYFCRQIPSMNDWHLGLTVLKLGNPYRCCQLEMFANEIANVFIEKIFVHERIPYNNGSKDLSRILLTNNQYIQPLFPQLISLVVFQSACINDYTRDVLLFVVARGSVMRRFTWRAYLKQAHHAKSFFDWLFQFAVNLNSCQLISPLGEDGFELIHEHMINSSYVPHHSLTYLEINVLNLSTLYLLLLYLPQLQHLGNSRTKCFLML